MSVTFGTLNIYHLTFFLAFIVAVEKSTLHVNGTHLKVISFLFLSASFNFFSLYFLFFKITMACLQYFFKFLVEIVCVSWILGLCLPSVLKTFKPLSPQIVSQFHLLFLVSGTPLTYMLDSLYVSSILSLFDTLASSTRGYINSNLNKINLNWKSVLQSQ